MPAPEPKVARAPTLIQRKYSYTAEELAKQLGLSGKFIGSVTADNGETWFVWTEEEQ